MIGFNAAHRPCGVLRAAFYFFVSEETSGLASGVDEGVAVAARALAAREVDFVQSRAEWPGPPQKRQSFFSRRRLRSSAVNRPSLPNFSDKSGPLEDDAPENVDGLEEEEDEGFCPEDEVMVDCLTA